MKFVFYVLFCFFCVKLCFTQYADKSVEENTIYKPHILALDASKVKLDVNSLFDRMELSVENDLLTNSKPFSSNVVTSESMLDKTLNYDSELDNITFYAQITMKVGNAILFNKLLTEEERRIALAGLRAPARLCPYPIVEPCSPSEIYRRADGTCTNFKVEYWGRELMPYKRFLPPRYQDGFGAVQKLGIKGHTLPNPRSISLILSNDNHQFDIARTSINSAFAQFIDHDYTAVAPSSASCSTCDDPNPECLSIATPFEDTLNSVDQNCMTSRRSAPAFTDKDCGMAHREQINKLTPPLDLSQVYGTNLKVQKTLRSFAGGRLKSTKKGINNRELLPTTAPGSCRDETPTNLCFLTGDGARSNQNLQLTSMHMLWLREHNRIAKKLALLNPTWNDETIFQEARRINIAQMQNILYSEWLPLIIGWSAIEKYDLLKKDNSYYRGYNDQIDIGVYNEFVTAAFRLHTLVRTHSTKLHPSFPSRTLTLQEITFRPVHAYEESGLDGLIAGALVDTIGKFDTSFTNGLQNTLFEVPGKQNVTTKRFDLAALNINRCRDHGCAPFIEYREWCGLGRATKFSDLVEMDVESQNKLASIYKDVANIELFVGGLSERPLPGAVVGPTFACMIARQFRDFKRGDRFFFENPSPINPKPFTLTQLAEIHKIKLSTLICENIDGITSIQPNAFLASIVPGNSKLSCASIPTLNLQLFAE